eukprot:scaffold9327_cov61-Phaeocystis_antarctica.AAC.1
MLACLAQFRMCRTDTLLLRATKWPRAVAQSFFAAEYSNVSAAFTENFPVEHTSSAKHSSTLGDDQAACTPSAACLPPAHLLLRCER